MTGEDENLIQRVAAAETEALGELYDRYGRLVYSLALAVVQDAGLAEEITQDVFLQVWHKAGSYQPELGKLTTWLTRIARNRAIDMLRRQKTRPEGRSVALDGLEDFFLDPMGVEPGVLARDARREVRRALAELPPDQRAVLRLAYFQGLTQQEIAEQLRQPLGTVKTRVRLAMQKLRSALGEEADTGERLDRSR